MESFIKLFEKSISERWDCPALEEYSTAKCSTYGELAGEVKGLKDLWMAAGIVPGDKISINARSSANWMRIFMAAACEGYVAVVLFNGFTPTDTQGLVCHSDSKLLYTEKKIFEGMDFDSMPMIKAAIDVNTGELLASRDGFDKLYSEAKPAAVKRGEVKFPEIGLKDMCAIMYTSGSTGSPKGVMLSVENFSSNIEALTGGLPFRPGENILSMLPFAHIFGLTVDGILPLSTGMHLYVLGLPPIPKILTEGLKKVKPHIFFGVPLVFMKLIEATMGDFIHSEEGKKKLDDYQNNPEYCETLKNYLMEAMGGNLETFLTGGAAIPEDLENLLAFKLKTPFATGYGMTECAPVLSFGIAGRYKAKSCGIVCNTVEIKIDSPDGEHIPGEVMVKGPQVFSGYYKNPEATAAVFTEDGWFRTGDMGTCDSERNLFLVGRCKNMLLSENGQNIYPEEIEVVLNTLPYVAESIVVQRGSRLCALIVINDDAATAAQLSAETLENIMKHNLETLNSRIPAYSHVADMELRYEPFAKTPKGSIRRFMYK